MAIRIRALRLVGASKDYNVRFTRDGAIRPLSTIAGEISTGKTSILEFIDYCLGASSHPTHQEIRRQARSAQLEVELSGQVKVIERPLFSHEKVAFVHHCSLSEMAERHAKTPKVIEPARAEDSLSMMLLDYCGLAGISLKEAPTQESSPAHPLSFRDVMWLAFLPNNRLDNKNLLHESGHYMEALKLRQVIEVVFDVHDDQAAKLSDALRKTEEDIRRQREDIRSLERFLADEEVPEQLTLAAELQGVDDRRREVAATLNVLSERMRAESDFAESLRTAYAEQQANATLAAGSVRYHETLIRRLLPLQSQYVEDESKLVFYEEAKTLFDPMRIEICPSCLKQLPEPATITHGECSLCGQTISEEAGEPIEVKAELAAVRSRRREIERYLESVHEELERARVHHRAAQAAETTAQQALDDAVTRRLSPYMGQREQLVRELETLRARRTDLERQVGWHDALERRRRELARLDEQAATLRQQIRDVESQRRSKADVIADLTDRFESILRSFGFPKLDDPEAPYFDIRFVPHVRGVTYDRIGSSGAMTLIALAWQLAIFERAVELGHPHPGFLMIDSPQKNLKPKEGATADEFTNPAIASLVWDHLLKWASSGAGATAQLIIVDNHPPEQAEKTLAVRYGGPTGPPPYGLIDTEV